MDQSLAQVELADRRRDRVSVLSGGLARRLEVARALLARPGVLLLDEPTSGLDPAARAEMWDAIEAQSREGTAVLYATHLGEEAERAHRVVILDQGKVVAEGDPATLKAQVGGDLIVVECEDPEAPAARVRERFGVPAPRGQGRRARRARARTRIRAGAGRGVSGRARSVTLRQPTLEDVFVHVTGKRFRARGST